MFDVSRLNRDDQLNYSTRVEYLLFDSFLVASIGCQTTNPAFDSQFEIFNLNSPLRPSILDLLSYILNFPDPVPHPTLDRKLGHIP